MISTGFACALVAADIGMLLVGHEVVSSGVEGTESLPPNDVPSEERDRLVGWLQAIVPAMHVGRFVSTDHVIGSASEKRAFADKTQAIGLDMESAALAAEAQRAQVPFVVVRTVSDLVDEDLPLDFNLFLRPTGWLKGIASVLSAPSSLLGLNRLRRQSLAAASTWSDSTLPRRAMFSATLPALSKISLGARLKSKAATVSIKLTDWPPPNRRARWRAGRAPGRSRTGGRCCRSPRGRRAAGRAGRCEPWP